MPYSNFFSAGVEAIIAQVSVAIGGLSGLGLIVSQIPGIPADLKSWPVTAMLTLVTLASLALAGFMVRGVFKTQTQAAEAQTRAAVTQGRAVEVQSDMNRRLDELCQKIGDANKESGQQTVALESLNSELGKRPCLMRND